MGAKKKAKKALLRAHKAAVQQAVEEGKVAKPAKLPKPPKDGAIKKQLKRVFGKKLKPDIDINEYSALISFEGITKLEEAATRRMLMQVLLACPTAE